MKSMFSLVSVSKSKLFSGFAAMMFSLVLASTLVVAGCSAPAEDNQNTAENAVQAEATLAVTVEAVAPGVSDFEPLSQVVEISEEGTVYDALMATDWELDVQDSQYGKYVNAISGLATGDAGSMSGWVFTVNGEEIMESCETYVLADGDTVEWEYLS